MENGKRRRKLLVPLMAAALVTIAALSFFIYVSGYSRADDIAVAALQSGDGVAVSQENGCIVFQPEGTKPKAGLIFYPGGKVETAGYAPLMRAVAERGYACVLPKMPFNLAVFDANAADRLIKAYPEISSWFVGGHSLGGSMAASWCAGNLDRCGGLVLLASYSASDLSRSGLPVLVITGSKDGVLNRAKFESSRANLPADAQFLEIAGGNHAQFGDYGQQKDDGDAGITASQQQVAAAEAIDSFITQALK